MSSVKIVTIKPPAIADYPLVFREEIELVPTVEDFCTQLAEQNQETKKIVGQFGEMNAGLRYAEGKWSVREVIGHLSDCERILSYRMLRFARGDSTVLAGFDQNAFVTTGVFESRSLSEVMEEFVAVRSATIALLRGVPESAFDARGTTGKSNMTVAALAYLIAGHELHHQELLRSRYLPLVQH